MVNKMTDENRRVILYGRRDEDSGKCAMHDLIQGKNTDCFDWIKRTVEINDDKMNRRFESMENSLSKFITKWAVGMVLSVATVMFGVIMGLSRYQIDLVHDDLMMVAKAVEKIADEQNDLRINQVKFNIIQQEVIKKIDLFKTQQEEIYEENSIKRESNKHGGIGR